MNIVEYAHSYCRDILDAYVNNSKLIEWTNLPYQELVANEEGTKYPAVFIDGEPVHVKSFIELDREDFIKEYPYKSSAEIYDNYITNIELTEGLELIEYLKNKARAEVEALKKNNEVTQKAEDYIDSLL